jgi:hypothetical protein
MVVIITVNLLIDYDGTRISQQCRDLVTMNPDIILLQEVHYKNLEVMENILTGYKTFTAFRDALACTKMGCMIFVRNIIEPQSVVYKKYDSTYMDRGYYAVTVDNVCCLTTHLESMNKPQFAEKREQQLKEIWNFVENKNFFIGMDSNIKSNINLPAGAVDLWESEPCPTWHAERFFGFNAKARFDRIITRGLTTSSKGVIENPSSDHDALVADVYN